MDAEYWVLGSAQMQSMTVVANNPPDWISLEVGVVNKDHSRREWTSEEANLKMNATSNELENRIEHKGSIFLLFV